MSTGTSLAKNPLEGYKIPGERDPRSATVDGGVVEGLLKVADKVHPYLSTLIILASSTGRRLSSVLGLRWDDIDFPGRRIRWRAETDKSRRTAVVPASRAALEALAPFRASHPAVGEVWWKDIMTLMECCQRPEQETLRSVVEYQKPKVKNSRSCGA